MTPAHFPESAFLDARSILPTKPTDPNGLVLSAWAQGYMTGSIIIMACITVANMRRGVLLHKLILIEVPITSVFDPLHNFPTLAQPSQSTARI